LISVLLGDKKNSCIYLQHFFRSGREVFLGKGGYLLSAKFLFHFVPQKGYRCNQGYFGGLGASWLRFQFTLSHPRHAEKWWSRAESFVQYPLSMNRIYLIARICFCQAGCLIGFGLLIFYRIWKHLFYMVSYFGELFIKNLHNWMFLFRDLANNVLCQPPK